MSIKGGKRTKKPALKSTSGQAISTKTVWEGQQKLCGKDIKTGLSKQLEGASQHRQMGTQKNQNRA